MKGWETNLLLSNDKDDSDWNQGQIIVGILVLIWVL